MTHPFIQKLRDRNPRTIAIYLDGREILRIVDGRRVVERTVDRARSHRLLTVHFDGDPNPVYQFLST